MKISKIHIFYICLMITMFTSCPTGGVDFNPLYIHFYKSNITIGFEEEIDLRSHIFVGTNNDSYNLTWSSISNSSLTVDSNGIVKGIAPTTEPVIITVSVTVDGYTASNTCSITVIDKPYYFDIEFVENDITIYVGDEKILPITYTTDQRAWGTSSSLFSSDTAKVEIKTINSSSGIIGLTPTTEPVIITINVNYNGYNYSSSCNVNVIGRGLIINLPQMSEGIVEEPVAGGNVFYGSGAVFSATIENTNDISDHNITWSLEPYRSWEQIASEETKVTNGILNVAAIDHGKTLILKATSSNVSIYDIKLITIVYALPSDFLGTWKTTGDGFFKDSTFIISDNTIEFEVLDEIPDVPFFPQHHLYSINFWRALTDIYWGDDYDINYPSGYFVGLTNIESGNNESWFWLLLNVDKNSLAEYSNANYVPNGSYYSIYLKQ